MKWSTQSGAVSFLYLLNQICFVYALKPGFGTKSDDIITVITGGTGILGTSLVSESISNYNYQTFASFRDSQKLTNVSRQSLISNILHPFFLDLDKLTISDILEIACLSQKSCFVSETLLNKCFQAQNLLSLIQACEKATKIVLINNAAICLEGRDKDTFIRTLFINALFPSLLTIFLKRHFKGKEMTVINISSGDGEIICLHSSIQKALHDIQNEHAWNSYITDLIQSYDPNIEYAVGDTPFYSLSKALLNSFTRALSFENELQSNSNNNKNHIRILSICPGNFISPIFNDADRVQDTDATQSCHTERSTKEIAKEIFEIGLNFENCYPDGMFYRYKKIISW